MAESVLHAVAGARMMVLFVLEVDLVAYTGSIAPSRRYLRSLDTPFLVILAFVAEQFGRLGVRLLGGRFVSPMRGFLLRR